MDAVNGGRWRVGTVAVRTVGSSLCNVDVDGG